MCILAFKKNDEVWMLEISRELLIHAYYFGYLKIV